MTYEIVTTSLSSSEKLTEIANDIKFWDSISSIKI